MASVSPLATFDAQRAWKARAQESYIQTELERQPGQQRVVDSGQRMAWSRGNLSILRSVDMLLQGRPLDLMLQPLARVRLPAFSLVGVTLQH